MLWGEPNPLAAEKPVLRRTAEPTTDFKFKWPCRVRKCSKHHQYTTTPAFSNNQQGRHEEDEPPQAPRSCPNRNHDNHGHHNRHNQTSTPPQSTYDFTSTTTGPVLLLDPRTCFLERHRHLPRRRLGSNEWEVDPLNPGNVQVRSNGYDHGSHMLLCRITSCRLCTGLAFVDVSSYLPQHCQLY